MLRTTSRKDNGLLEIELWRSRRRKRSKACSLALGQGWFNQLGRTVVTSSRKRRYMPPDLKHQSAQTDAKWRLRLTYMNDLEDHRQMAQNQSEKMAQG